MPYTLTPIALDRLLVYTLQPHFQLPVVNEEIGNSFWSWRLRTRNSIGTGKLVHGFAQVITR